ncbi:MAG TPA: ABC transporter ATP-binding protein [Bacillota bacterium]|nr:ABC transporter ATP-binding protein [Bacillota bacterium]HOH09661.1 ABC transporter ATP-binding protein [Bacillota bacterium]HOY88957.1 ABC transporter ATP-binding protein [Bacillota bacterium]HPI00548.1 ABC transporter ATP-binding protein [Bacillota bacterium]HPM62970.1 ABC transporter ATP-binding protein [Bacillota bacterium]
MAEVILKGVTKKFGKTVAVSGLDLEVKDKELLVLVGPSGCGKTTTLRMIAGLDDPDEGEIFIEGKSMKGVEPKDRDIAMVFQNYALYPHMDVYNNMAFGLKMQKMPAAEIEARVKEAAKILGIEDLLERKPKALSGGQKQRVALGRAIVRKPRVFLMDEPLSNLDAKLRVQMRAELSRIHKRIGATIVYVTHDQTEAMTMGERIVLMKDGIIQQQGEPMQLYDDPVNIFVAGFIGSPSMNLIDGKIRNTYDGACFDSGDLTISLPEKRFGSLASRDGLDVVLGIRPEHIEDAEFAPMGADRAVLGATADVVEPMGSETLLYVTAKGGTQVTAKVNPSTKAAFGKPVTLSADLTKAHLFDRATGLAMK